MSDPPTPRVALLGYPLAHSVSPAMHHAAARALGIPLRYDLWPLQAGALGDAVQSIRGDPWLGANVTLPHKPAMLALVDEMSAQARRIGAINTLYKRGGRLLGENTDAPAFVACLRQQLDFQPAEERALILGAGGAARAAVVALLDTGVRSLALWNRTPGRADALVADLAAAGVPTAPLQILDPAALDAGLLGLTLLVNATSAGLDGRSLPVELPMRDLRGVRIFDMVYGPSGTPLVLQATAHGLTAVDGLWMLVRQAAAAFALWTGRQAPEETMYTAALAALAERAAAQSWGIPS